MKSNKYRKIYNNDNNEKPKDIIVRNMVNLIRQINGSILNETKVLSKKIKAKPIDKTNK